MEFRLLGPLEVAEHDRLLVLGGIKPRSLLALLLLHANEVVSADRLIDELWGDEPPATVAKSVQVHVSRLRKELGEGRLVTRAPGYVLHVDPSELDLARFERLIGEARNADPEAARRSCARPLELWRGPALADLAYEAFAQTEIARLEELRLAALEQRIDADLATGRHAEGVGELEALVAGYPLRERLRCQLMLALYRSGRQAEALGAYRAARRVLSEELGLEPSEELRRLEQAILRHDPALEPAASSSAAPDSTPIDRSILIVPARLDDLAPLLELAKPLAASEPPHELIVASVVERPELGPATAALTEQRQDLLADGLTVRTAAFASPTPARDIVRLAHQQDVDLLLMNAAQPPLGGAAGAILEQAPCDVALLARAGDSFRGGPVAVPFGAAWHDWAALELGPGSPGRRTRR
jgi:DNA-binding SARP family transcriptional activator